MPRIGFLRAVRLPIWNICQKHRHLFPTKSAKAGKSGMGDIGTEMIPRLIAGPHLIFEDSSSALAAVIDGCEPILIEKRPFDGGDGPVRDQLVIHLQRGALVVHQLLRQKRDGKRQGKPR